MYCVRDLWGRDAWLCTHGDVWASNLSLVSISPLSDAMQHYQLLANQMRWPLGLSSSQEVCSTSRSSGAASDGC